MKVGSIVYATNQGLGILAKDFYDNGIVTDVLVHKHRSRHNNLHWYPHSHAVDYGMLRRTASVFMRGLDVLLMFETPFDWEIMKIAKAMGIKTVLMPMYECTPQTLPYTPDHFLNPSALDQDYYPQGVFLPIPVNEPWYKRERARVFVHNSGHGGLKGRNGTPELIESIPLIKSPIKLIIRSQEPIELPFRDSRVEVIVGTVPKEELYKRGDVFVFPEQFNGLSLPLQEAFASGMAVVATDRYPTNTWLPREYLIKTIGEREERIGGCNKFFRSIVSPYDIAEAIDSIYDKDVSYLSEAGKDWAEKHSWDVLRPRYLEYLEWVAKQGASV